MNKKYLKLIPILLISLLIQPTNTFGDDDQSTKKTFGKVCVGAGAVACLAGAGVGGYLLNKLGALDKKLSAGTIKKPAYERERARLKKWLWTAGGFGVVGLAGCSLGGWVWYANRDDLTPNKLRNPDGDDEDEKKLVEQVGEDCKKLVQKLKTKRDADEAWLAAQATREQERLSAQKRAVKQEAVRKEEERRLIEQVGEDRKKLVQEIRTKKSVDRERLKSQLSSARERRGDLFLPSRRYISQMIRRNGIEKACNGAAFSREEIDLVVLEGTLPCRCYSKDCWYGDNEEERVALVERLIDAGKIDVNEGGPMSLLRLCFSRYPHDLTNSNEMVKLFLRHGATLNLNRRERRNFDLTNQLMCKMALLCSTDEMKRYVKQCGVDVNIRGPNRVTPLHRLFFKNAMPPVHHRQKIADIVTKFLACGAYVDVEMVDGITPLMMAATRFKIESVKKLLEAGADVSAGYNKVFNGYREESVLRREDSVLRVTVALVARYLSRWQKGSDRSKYPTEDDFQKDRANKFTTVRALLGSCESGEMLHDLSKNEITCGDAELEKLIKTREDELNARAALEADKRLEFIMEACGEECFASFQQDCFVSQQRPPIRLFPSLFA